MKPNVRPLLFTCTLTVALLTAARPCPARTLWVNAGSRAQGEDGSAGVAAGA